MAVITIKTPFKRENLRYIQITEYRVATRNQFCLNQSHAASKTPKSEHGIWFMPLTLPVTVGNLPRAHTMAAGGRCLTIPHTLPPCHGNINSIVLSRRVLLAAFYDGSTNRGLLSKFLTVSSRHVGFIVQFIRFSGWMASVGVRTRARYDLSSLVSVNVQHLGHSLILIRNLLHDHIFNFKAIYTYND